MIFSKEFWKIGEHFKRMFEIKRSEEESLFSYWERIAVESYYFKKNDITSLSIDNYISIKELYDDLRKPIQLGQALSIGEICFIYEEVGFLVIRDIIFDFYIPNSFSLIEFIEYIETVREATEEELKAILRKRIEPKENPMVKEENQAFYFNNN